MKLNFPNPCRSFDDRGKRVRFWGYDSTIEVSFFVEVEALQKLCPDMRHTENELLKAFDSVREHIHEVAEKIHAHGPRGSFSHTLAAEDF